MNCRALIRPLPSVALALVAACGGDYNLGGSGASATYTIGGTVTGLTGSGLLLVDNDNDRLTVSAAGTFKFSKPIASGATYLVSIETQPLAPTQYCAVGSGSGTVRTANVTSVLIACSNEQLHFAYAASVDDSTIAAYLIDPATGALNPASTPVSTGLSPRGIAVSRDGLHVYVANESSNNISAYAVDVASGVLTPVAGSPFPAGSNPRALVLADASPTRTYLYVANRGSNNLSAYSVNTGTGVLTPLTPATYAAGAGPSAILTDAWGPFIFVANSDSSNISAFSIRASTGELAQLAGSPFAAGGSPHSLAVGYYTDWYSYASEFLYTANTNGTGSTISGFSVDSFGKLTALSGSPFQLAVSNDIVIDATYQYLYATTGAGLLGYRIDVGTGVLTALPDFPVVAGANAYSLAADRSNGFLYAGNDASASISGFRPDSLSGLLMPVPGSPFATGNRPDSLAVH